MKNKPAGSDLVIANSSETIIPAHNGYMPQQAFTAAMGMNNGGGSSEVTIGDINVSVNGVDNPKDIANQVAEEILYALRKTSYTELNVT